MAEPTRRTSRQALALGAIAAVLLAGGGYLAGTAYGPRSELPAAAPPPQATPATVPPAAVPLPQPPLGRRDLIAAAGRAADAYASGIPVDAATADLVGRRFEIRIPFGCFGPTPEEAGAPLRWTYEDEALRLSARPETWTDAAWLRSIAGGEGFEAAEGFWLPYPWSGSESCPAARGAIDRPVILMPPRETLGIVQLFEPGASRAQRREGKPYQAVSKVKPEELAAAQGFRLVLRGRIAALPNGQPIGCHSDGVADRPTCLVAAQIAYVAFENPATGEILAEWQS